MLHSVSGNQWQSLTEEAHSTPNRLGWYRLMAAKRYVASARRYRTYSRSIQPGCVHDNIRNEAVVMIGDRSGLSKMLPRCQAMTMSANADNIDAPANPLELRQHAADVTLSVWYTRCRTRSAAYAFSRSAWVREARCRVRPLHSANRHHAAAFEISKA